MTDRCLCCNKHLNAVAPISDPDAMPDPGDTTVCLYCGHLMKFAADLSLRQLTDAEIVECAGDPKIIQAVRYAGRIRDKLEQGGPYPDDGDY